jgi:hypothetical protein
MAHEYSNPVRDSWTGAVNEAKTAYDPYAERKQIEASLAYYGPVVDGDSSNFRVLVEAARKHLETLPKPAPLKFRVVGQRRSGGGEACGYIFSFRDLADAEAAEWMTTGEYDSVAVEQVS